MSDFVEQYSTFANRQRPSIEGLQHRSRGNEGNSSLFGMKDGAETPRFERSGRLHEVVVAEILPRLALARQTSSQRSSSDQADYVTTDVDTLEMVRLLLTQAAEGATAFVDLLRLRGATPEALYLGILSDSARFLGHLWEEDRCDFAQVTISVGRLQQVARLLSADFQSAAVLASNGYSILLLPAPGEQHTFGLLMLAEFFQRSGWRVTGGPGLARENPVEMVRNTWFDLAGFSIGSESMIGSLTVCIRKVRRASRNRGLGVMVGGPVLLIRQDLASLVGADAAATDAPGAIRQASGLLTMRAAAE